MCNAQPCAARVILTLDSVNPSFCKVYTLRKTDVCFYYMHKGQWPCIFVRVSCLETMEAGMRRYSVNVLV